MTAAVLRLLLLLPALARAGDIARVPALNVKVQAAQAVAGALPGLSIPAAIPQLIPALPQSEIPRLGAELAAPVLSLAERERGGWLPFKEGLERLRQAQQSLEQSAAGKGPDGDAARPLFDGSSSDGEAPPAGWAPALPQGVLRVEVHKVLSTSDIGRVIPEGANSRLLIERLKEGVAAMAPYRVFTYHDARGGRFTGIDLSVKPQLVDMLPEQQSHEVRLIKKIQLYNKDLQVVVREDGKTPDVVLGGMVTELKSRIRSSSSLGQLVNHANTQVYEHARRHGLGDGAVAVDLVKEPSVSAEAVIQELNAWSLHPVGEVFERRSNGEKFVKDTNALLKVYVFSRSDMRIFERRRDGTYVESRATRTRASSKIPSATRITRKVHVAQLLLKSGRGQEAANLVRNTRAVERAAGIAPESESQLAQAQRRVLARTPFVEETEGELIRREIDGPRAALAQFGVRATVTVYGGARVKVGSPWYTEARKFGRLVAKKGGAGVALVTGGGPGIMEAANRGARSAKGLSVGHNIILPSEQAPNFWQTPGLSFNYQSFAARKSNMRHAAAAHVYFPGGFGTMDELFELLTLMQTGKLAKAPIILVGGKEYWGQVLDFKAFSRLGLIAQADLDLFAFASTAKEAWALVAPALAR